jgi:transmembrane sensor
MSIRRPGGGLHSQIREEAVEWFVAFCEEEVDARACREFNAWLRRSPEHVRAYLRVSAFWEDAADLERHTKHGIEELVQRAVAEGNVVALGRGMEIPMPRARGGNDRARALSWLAGLAAACAGVGLAGWLVLSRTPSYSTTVGEQRTITLPDGSTVELNARSRVSVRYTRAKREVNLTEGQALFRVAKSPSRPFIVLVAGTGIRAVGTEFDVYRKRNETVVTVVEGQVAVSETRGSELTSADPSGRGGDTASVLVSAGQQFVATPRALDVPKPVDTATATAWTEGKLVFDSVALKDVLDEFNRYLPRPLVLTDPKLLSMHISGVFSVTESQQFLEFLHQRFGTVTHETDTEVHIGRH